ncbi:DUF3883 domain-containing protein [Bradyrhizobium sp. 930_D9_N1_4]|uniref:DUF3883 domain-containing protein n=1 Tax=Bradyrhizobium sp. 930_D9_N1_4 TaxID=3240374 RepID=UPI003F89CD26
MALGPLSNANYSDFFIESVASSGLNNYEVQRLTGSRLTITFEKDNTTYRYRILLFAVGGSGRSNALERRIEITSTYAGGNLVALPGFSDLVIGIDRQGRNMIGLDPRRLQFGGSSHNASTFVYLPALDRLRSMDFFLFPNDRQTLFLKEYQVYFKPRFVGNYLAEFSLLHGSGLRQTPLVHVDDSLSDAIEELAAFGSKQKLSYQQQVELALKKMEIGRVGEAFVLEQERARLRAAGRSDLAKNVDWVSQRQPYVGYDIKSFKNTGDSEFIEVKSSSGVLKSFYLTENELRQARRLSQKYRIACVSNALKSASVRNIVNPAGEIDDGRLAASAVSYKVLV